MNALITRPLDALARSINEEQSQIEQHAKGMLLSAKAAGELLIEAKKQLAHGEFKSWVERNTRLSLRRAQEYMQLTRHAKGADLRAFADKTIDAVLRELRGTEPKPTTTNLPTFTEDDAEYALKIAARMGSDFQGERENATNATACGLRRATADMTDRRQGGF